jgi:hypothetical protein
MNPKLEMKFLYFFLVNYCFIHADNFILLTTLHHEKHPQRRDEFAACIEKNLQNPLIEKVIIFFEDTAPNLQVFDKFSTTLKNATHPKLQIIDIKSRPAFSDLIDYANLNLPDQKILLANADIFYDSSLKKMTSSYLTNTLVGLTRYDKTAQGWLTYSGIYHLNGKKYQLCFDTWIFKTPFNAKIDPVFKMGQMGCEKFMLQAYHAGYQVLNPCKDIISYHLHDSNVRNYINYDQYRGFPICYLPECKLAEKYPPLASWTLLY